MGLLLLHSFLSFFLFFLLLYSFFLSSFLFFFPFIRNNIQQLSKVQVIQLFSNIIHHIFFNFCLFGKNSSCIKPDLLSFFFLFPFLFLFLFLQPLLHFHFSGTLKQ